MKSSKEDESSRDNNLSIVKINCGSLASFFEGLDELKIKPGINIKAAINFEFSPSKSATALEVGFLGDFYPGGVNIMPTAREYSFYPTAFITLFYGRKY